MVGSLACRERWYARAAVARVATAAAPPRARHARDRSGAERGATRNRDKLVTDQEIAQLFLPLYADLRPEEGFDAKKPLLAHYTTFQVLEQILANNEVWFSNPLFMNDLEEVRFGIIQGNELVMTRPELEAACKTPERAQLFKDSFAFYFNRFADEHVLDTYIFCLSNHGRDDNDGLLSMWRGYGANGNGVAIVFDAAQFDLIEESALIVAKVSYDSTEARLAWLKNLLIGFETAIRGSEIPDDKLRIAANMLFERIKLFALFTKHRGFKEEDEWRVVYLPERDVKKQLEPMFHYRLGPRGVEPKLKFKMLPVKGLTGDDLSLAKTIDRIILGPTVASPMALATVQRMFDVLNRSELKSKLRASTIPFRAIG